MASLTLRRRLATARVWFWARYSGLRRGITPGGLCVIAVAFVAADASDQLAGSSLFLGAPLDEAAHVLTTLLVLWAMGGILYERMLTPALIASVAIDLDHVPARLGAHWLTAGTPRPYTHSLLALVVVLAGAYLWRRRRDMLVGVAIGLVIHFWRDMAEPNSGVALLWPTTVRGFSLPHASYLLVMAGVFAVGLRRSIRFARVRRPDGSDPRSTELVAEPDASRPQWAP